MPHASHTPAECDVAKLIQSDSRLLLAFARWSGWVGLGLLIILCAQKQKKIIIRMNPGAVVESPLVRLD
jgi:hypothetical protein